MSEVENINFFPSIVDAQVGVESLLETVVTGTQAIEDLNHHIQATDAKTRQDIGILQNLIASFDSTATGAHEKIEAARQHLKASFESLEHRAEELQVQVQHEFLHATQQVSEFEQHIVHLLEGLKSEWNHSIDAQNDLEGALGHNKEQLRIHYDQVLQDYREDFSSHLSQTVNLLSHEMDGHRTLQQEVASAIEQTVVQQQQSLGQAGESLASHCSALLGNLQLISRQSLDNLHQSFESQIGGLQEGAQRLIGELGQAADYIKKVISDLEGAVDAVKTGGELTNVGIRDVIAILGEIIHLLENLEKDIQDVVSKI